MLKLRFALGLLAVLSSAKTFAQIYPQSGPVNQGAATAISPRNFALGESHFSDPSQYNLYDQGGSPMGLLETHAEKVRIDLGLLSSNRATSGDSLQTGHHDYYLPQVGFFQPGVFAVLLYYQRQTESFQTPLADSLDVGKSLFGFDLAAGPASGLFRIGFGAHALLGGMDYPGTDHRVLLGIPSLRLDVGSRPVPDVEVGIFGGVAGRFDSLKSTSGRLERIAAMTLPRYGALIDVDSLRGTGLSGNTVLELGTDRMFGEYRQAGQPGVVYPILWTGYWDFQTQWMYALEWNDFHFQPSARFAHRSEDAQGYVGILSNQNPFKKGAEIPGLSWTHGVTDFGLGGNVEFQKIVSLLLEWETSGHTLAADTAAEKHERYQRFSLGLENHLEQFAALRFPEGLSLALRLGWTMRQEAAGNPGVQDFQFDPFVPTSQVSTRSGFVIPTLENPMAYEAFHLGFGLGLMEKHLEIEGLLSFPGQRERMLPASRTNEATGMEFGLKASYRVF